MADGMTTAEIAEMIADFYGRSMCDADYKLAALIIEKACRRTPTASQPLWATSNAAPQSERRLAAERVPSEASRLIAEANALNTEPAAGERATDVATRQARAQHLLLRAQSAMLTDAWLRQHSES